MCKLFSLAFPPHIWWNGRGALEIWFLVRYVRNKTDHCWELRISFDVLNGNLRLQTCWLAFNCFLMEKSHRVERSMQGYWNLWSQVFPDEDQLEWMAWALIGCWWDSQLQLKMFQHVVHVISRVKQNHYLVRAYLDGSLRILHFFTSLI